MLSRSLWFPSASRSMAAVSEIENVQENVATGGGVLVGCGVLVGRGVLVGVGAGVLVGVGVGALVGAGAVGGVGVAVTTTSVVQAAVASRKASRKAKNRERGGIWPSMGSVRVGCQGTRAVWRGRPLEAVLRLP